MNKLQNNSTRNVKSDVSIGLLSFSYATSKSIVVGASSPKLPRGPLGDISKVFNHIKD